jgi:hypothetical protein
MNASGVVGQRSVKDILSYIALWHAHAVTLLFRAERGQTLRLPDDPAGDLLDDVLRADPRPFESVWADFEGAQRQLVRRLAAWKDESALFDAKRYPALRGQPLAEVVWQYAVARSARCRQRLEAWLAEKPEAR